MKMFGSTGLVVVVLLTYVNCLWGMEEDGGVAVESSRLADQVLAKGRSRGSVFEKRRVLKLVPVENVGSVDKEALRRMAEAEGYGYKTANLQMLKALAGTLNVFLEEQGHNYRLGVPAFVGISSTAVKDFLKSRGVDIADRWQGLLREIFPDEAERTIDHRMFKDKKFPDGFLAKVKRDLVEPIVHVFKEVSGAGGENVLRLSDDKQEELDRLIQDARSRDKRLMVRSTGKEDTDKLANAGGNETKANVMPTMEAVLDAMKEVVVSYFGEKSFIQRLGAGDATVFEEPMTPVLVQMMIGEKPGGEEELGKIPRCGVMFTEEPEGGLSRLHPDDMSKTSGISIIQASYGHNEGVVNSIVSVDTYYVDKDGNLFPVIRPKFFRLIPLEASGQLGRSGRHPNEWCYVPAIRTEEVMVLKLLANSLEQYYRCPMDVEFVLSDGIIYVVQARPIVHNPKQPKPSYLKSPAIANKIGCEAIGVAGGKLRDLRSSMHCIARATIGEALAFYQEPTTDRGAVECIVIGEHAPATSHEATTFRSELKPVVITAKWEQVARWLEEGKRVIVDVQRGIIAPWEGTDEQLVAAVVEKWLCYPIPMSISMWPRSVSEEDFDAVVSEAGVSEADHGHVEHILKNLKSIQRSLAPFDADVARQIGLVSQNWMFLRKLGGAAGSVCVAGSREEIHRLLYRRFLDAVERQQVALGKSGEIVDGFSVVTLKKESRAEKAAKGTLTGEADPGLVQLMKLKEAALTERLSECWSDFVTKKVAVAAQGQRESFYELIHTLGTVGALELWLHTEFARVGSAESSTLETLLSKCWNGETSTFMKALAEKKKLLQQTNLKGVADPHKFKKIWDDFTAHMVSGWEGEFIEQFTKATNTARLAALPVMVDFVTVFDGALKEMSRSPAYKIVTNPTTADEADRINIDRDKGFVFKLMLQTYLAVLQQWYSLYLKVGGPELRRGGSSETKYLTKELPAYIERILGTQKTDFQATNDFNVSEAATGSACDSFRAGVTSLEDAFTLIHQSLLQVVSLLSTQCGLSVDKKSPFFLALPVSLQKVLRAGMPGHFLSVFFKHNEVCILYNWPQLNHSAEIRVTYNKKIKEVALQLSFVGPSHWGRWSFCADLWRAKSAFLYRFPANLDIALKIRGVTGTWVFQESDILDEHLKNLRELWEDSTHFNCSAARWEWVTRDNFDAFLEYALEFGIPNYFYQEVSNGARANTFLNPALRPLTDAQRDLLVAIARKIMGDALYRKQFENVLFLRVNYEPIATFDQYVGMARENKDVSVRLRGAQDDLLRFIIPTILREAGVTEEAQQAMLEGFNEVPFYGDVVRLKRAAGAAVVPWDAGLYKTTVWFFRQPPELAKRITLVYTWVESVFKKLSQAMLQQLEHPEGVAESVSLLEEGMVHPFEGSATVATWVVKALETNPQAVAPLMEKVARYSWHDAPDSVTALLRALEEKGQTASIPFPVGLVKQHLDELRTARNLDSEQELRLTFLVGYLNHKITTNDFDAAFELCEVFTENNNSWDYFFETNEQFHSLVDSFFKTFLESLARYITTNNVAAINARALKMVIQLLKKKQPSEPCHKVLTAALRYEHSRDDEVVELLSSYWVDVWAVLFGRGKGFRQAIQHVSDRTSAGSIQSNNPAVILLNSLLSYVPKDMEVALVEQVVELGVTRWKRLQDDGLKSNMVAALVRLVPHLAYEKIIERFLLQCSLKNAQEFVTFLPLFEPLVAEGRYIEKISAFAVEAFGEFYRDAKDKRERIRSFLFDLLVSLQRRFQANTLLLDMVSTVVTSVVGVSEIYMSWGMDSVLSYLLQDLVERERNYKEALIFVKTFALQQYKVHQSLWQALFEKGYRPAFDAANDLAWVFEHNSEAQGARAEIKGILEKFESEAAADSR